MSFGSIAVFLEPEGTLLEALSERKAWLEAEMPGQPLCAHPPHCTLLFGRYGSPSFWLDSLRANLAPLPSFDLETQDWQHFADDKMTGSGQTIAYRVRLTPALGSLQRTVADTLAGYQEKSEESHPLSGIEPFSTSLRRYGFPFVGPHWIPHFTIASPLVRSDAPLICRLKSGTAAHQFLVGRISVWRVDGDRHERLHELGLGDDRPHESSIHP